MGISGFCIHVYSNSSLKKDVLQGAYDLVVADRDGNLGEESKTLLVDSIRMFYSLGVYTKDFAPKFIGDSEVYLLVWASKKSLSLDLPGYVSECHRLVEDEKNRCDRFHLDKTTRDTLETNMEVSFRLSISTTAYWQDEFYHQDLIFSDT